MKFPAAIALSRRSRTPSGPPQRNVWTFPSSRDKLPEQIDEAHSLLMSVLRDFLHRGDRVAVLPTGQVWDNTALYNGPRAMPKVGRRIGMKLNAMTQLIQRLERWNRSYGTPTLQTVGYDV